MLHLIRDPSFPYQRNFGYNAKHVGDIEYAMLGKIPESADSADSGCHWPKMLAREDTAVIKNQQPAANQLFQSQTTPTHSPDSFLNDDAAPAPSSTHQNVTTAKTLKLEANSSQFRCSHCSLQFSTAGAYK